MMPQRLLVPLFQRPYVWNEGLQWEPLWKDVVRVAERLLAQPGAQHQPHFLGAVVLQQMQNPAGELQQRTVIDGQQRLTTLQILLDAVHLQMEDLGVTASAARLEPLIENASPFQKRPEDQFKVWPTNKDRPAFNEVMGKPTIQDYDSLANKYHRLVQAHKYFATQSRDWMETEGEEKINLRAEVLEKTLRELLQMVVIDLAPQENAQEIFETLNARGAILTPADLIKNFIFQKLMEQGVNVEEAYESYWKDFETAFWEEEISTGRVKQQRSSVFIGQWLIAKVKEEVVAREVFTRFKTYAEFESGKDMLSLLKSLHAAAQVYREFELLAKSEDAPHWKAHFSYRLAVMELDTIRPIVIALTDPEFDKVDDRELRSCFSVLESWLVRRMLVRATTKAYNKIVPDILAGMAANRKNPSQFLETYLRSQKVDYSYWPDDEELRRELQKLEVYRRIYRSRVRMIFEALEDHARGWIGDSESLAGSRITRKKYVIEHLMPRSWFANWPINDGYPEHEREKLIHTLGNLTLLSSKLNSKVSNGPWKQKRQHIYEHDLLALNKEVLAVGEDTWNEKMIEARTDKLIAAIVELWPCPEGHHVTFSGGRPGVASPVSVSDLMSFGSVNLGQTLFSRPGKFSGFTATVLEGGRIAVDDKEFESLSQAGWHIRRKNTNGWTFWRNDSGKTMADLRREYELALGADSGEDSDDSEEDE